MARSKTIKKPYKTNLNSLFELDNNSFVNISNLSLENLPGNVVKKSTLTSRPTPKPKPTPKPRPKPKQKQKQKQKSKKYKNPHKSIKTRKNLTRVLKF